jgi:hypothetical protein
MDAFCAGIRCVQGRSRRVRRRRLEGRRQLTFNFSKGSISSMRDFRLSRFAVIFSGLAAFAPAWGCGEGEPFMPSAGGEGASENGSSGASGTDTANAAGGPDTGGSPGQSEGEGGKSNEACKLDDDCAPVESDCAIAACIDGECIETLLAADTACEGGACDGEGACVASSCESGDQDGDETGVDCGGSCTLCDNGAGCQLGTDCISGVCTNQECQPSGCTDGVLNGTETDVDCGGSCLVKCAPGEACGVSADCAVGGGLGPESVRCLEEVCTNTQPPSDGLRYWQDFEEERLIMAAPEVSCHAADDMCLYGNGAHYQMHGLDAAGKLVGLTKAKLFTPAGAVGSGGKFDGSYCLTRRNSNLSAAGLSAFTVMAWVKPTRSVKPWLQGIFGGLNHYMLSIDSEPTAQRFLAAVETTQYPGFTYLSATSTAQVVTGQWHHVAITYDTADAAFVQYVDGAEVLRTTVKGSVNDATVHVFMGCRQKADAVEQLFIGTLDEVALYNTRALSAAELSDYFRRSQPSD